MWCAKHRDGWCAIKPNRQPPEDVFQVETRCGYFIFLPWDFADREPTCRECCPTPSWLRRNHEITAG